MRRNYLILFLFALSVQNMGCSSISPRRDSNLDWRTELETKSCVEVTNASVAENLNPKFETRFEGCSFFFQHPSSRFSSGENLSFLDTCVSKEPSDFYEGIGAKAVEAAVTANAQEREKIKAQFVSLRARAVESCCQGDSVCANVIAKTQQNWCDVPVDEKSKAPCREGGVFTNQTDASWKQWQEQRKILEDSSNGYVRALSNGYVRSIKKRGLHKNQITLPLFEIFLSQRVRAHSRAPLSNARVIAHELGHVCVNTKRFQAIRSNDIERSRAAFSLSNDLGWTRTEDGLSPRCTPTAAHEKMWKHLGASVGLNEASMDCLRKIAALVHEPRFSGGESKVCKPVCKNDIWDEALADAAHFDILPASDWFPQLFPGYCTYRRDGSHALTADQLSCYLLTPAFKKKIEAGWGCRYGT